MPESNDGSVSSADKWWRVLAAESRSLVAPALILAFLAGYGLTVLWAVNVPEIDQMYTSRPETFAELDLWINLLGGVGGFAFALFLASMFWLDELIYRREGTDWGQFAIWVVAILIVLLCVIVATTATSSFRNEPTFSGDVGSATKVAAIVVAVFVTPGFAVFLALRSAAMDDRRWPSDSAEAVELLLRWRRSLRRQLGAFGALLTLIVVATGMRRRALLAYDDSLNLPVEQVLLYGLLFAALLAAFYFAVTAAFARRSRDLVDAYAALPALGDEDWPERIKSRESIAKVVSEAGTLKNFETSVAIGSPLLTALIGTAIG